MNCRKWLQFTLLAVFAASVVFMTAGCSKKEEKKTEQTEKTEQTDNSAEKKELPKKTKPAQKVGFAHETPTCEPTPENVLSVLDYASKDADLILYLNTYDLIGFFNSQKDNPQWNTSLSFWSDLFESEEDNNLSSAEFEGELLIFMN